MCDLQILIVQEPLLSLTAFGNVGGGACVMGVAWRWAHSPSSVEDLVVAWRMIVECWASVQTSLCRQEVKHLSECLGRSLQGLQMFPPMVTAKGAIIRRSGGGGGGTAAQVSKVGAHVAGDVGNHC